MLILQSTYLMSDEQTAKREYVSLEAIQDNYEKYIISLDDIAFHSNNGINHIQAWKLGVDYII